MIYHVIIHNTSLTVFFMLFTVLSLNLIRLPLILNQLTSTLEIINPSFALSYFR